MTFLPDGAVVDARVRFTRTIEGVLTGWDEGGVYINNRYWSTHSVDEAGAVIEVLELPRPDEPTEVNAVVLARHQAWQPDATRTVFVREGGTVQPLWIGSGFKTMTQWCDLKDITVLHPGGVV